MVTSKKKHDSLSDHWLQSCLEALTERPLDSWEAGPAAPWQISTLRFPKRSYDRLLRGQNIREREYPESSGTVGTEGPS